MNAAAGDALPLPLGAFVALAVLAFLLFWVALVWLIGQFGWKRLADAFEASSDPPQSSRRIRWGSLTILSSPMRKANYGGCIDAWLSETGLWLRPMLVFRINHPMLCIPWARIQSVTEERIFGFRRVRVALGTGVPDLMLAGRLAQAVLERSARA
jgi:hypothetical protein